MPSRRAPYGRFIVLLLSRALGNGRIAAPHRASLDRGCQGRPRQTVGCELVRCGQHPDRSDGPGPCPHNGTQLSGHTRKFGDLESLRVTEPRPRRLASDQMLRLLQRVPIPANARQFASVVHSHGARCVFSQLGRLPTDPHTLQSLTHVDCGYRSGHPRSGLGCRHSRGSPRSVHRADQPPA